MMSPILTARELRWHTRRHLAQTHRNPLLSITLRAPHQMRSEEDYRRAFALLCGRFERLLRKSGQKAVLLLSSMDADGPARHYAVEDTIAVKEAAVRFEETQPGGALMDIDLMDLRGEALSREDLGQPPRPCAVCGQRPAAGCITGRLHSKEEVEDAFQELLNAALSRAPSHVGGLAVRALLYEASVSPKPGLVDRLDPGAHRDMDYYTFLSSAAALGPWFDTCAREGEAFGGPPEELLERIRPMGIQAERDMFYATDGVNTHKGAIFSLGILCAAAGHMGLPLSARALCAMAAKVAQPALKDHPDGSHGHQVQAQYGGKGARGEAADGFPSALAALEVLRTELSNGESVDRAGLKALLHLMSFVEDSNVLYRAGQEGLERMRQGAKELLALDVPEDKLQAYIADMRAAGISAGGCADLLAIAFFLYFITMGMHT